MSRLLTAIALSTVLAGCDSSNPFDDTNDVDVEQETDVDGEETVADDGTIFATSLNADLTGDSFVYDDQGTADTSDDTLRVNNIPFDNSDISGGGYTASDVVLNNAFDVYESDAANAGTRQYYAVFQRATYSEVAAIGTGDYVEFGFGGATAQRLGDENGIPAERAAFYTFTGDYAAVRVTTNAGGSDDVEYVTGDAELNVDILDFDVSGAVEGVVDNRELFDVDGNSLGSLNDFVSLATAEIDFSNGDIGSSTAIGGQFVVNDEGVAEVETITEGQWQGFFAGPDGDEVAGFVVLEGETTALEEPDVVRETGVFIVTNTE